MGDVQKNNYGFKSRNFPTVVPELVNFENDLILMVENVEFRKRISNFQKTLREDVEKIKKSD